MFCFTTPESCFPVDASFGFCDELFSSVLKVETLLLPAFFFALYEPLLVVVPCFVFAAYRRFPVAPTFLRCQRSCPHGPHVIDPVLASQPIIL